MRSFKRLTALMGLSIMTGGMIQMVLEDLKDRINKASYQIEANKKLLDKTRKDLAECEDQMNSLILAGNLLKTIGEQQREKTISTFERVITLALKEIFDSEYTFKIEVVADKRVSTKFKLIKGDMEMELLTAVGGGVVNVVSFVLKVLILASVRPKRQQIMFLDEQFNNVSADYRPRVAKLLKSFSDQLGIQFVLITHQQEFTDAADVVYNLCKGQEGTIVTRVV
jgi:DNA repair exonuclease SbcCD ATPase subunit